MYKQQSIDRFIGRSREIETFTRWFEDPAAPLILYFYDAAEQADRKGGVGKTWLLRKCAELAGQRDRETVVVMLDFFNVGDRDRVFLTEKIMAGLQELYPTWFPEAFTKVIQQYRVEERRSGSAGSEIRIREEVSSALADDLQRLDQQLAQEQKRLLIFFDTFEAIEQNPAVAVLRPSQTFPDNYQLECIRIVMAGRNELDWTHANWRGREAEVQCVALPPFDEQEMLEYIRTDSIYDLPAQSQQAHALYERTEGRPIIIGLVIDILNNRIQTLDELVAVSKAEFEASLVPQVNKLENPLNWVILFMAHVYHRFHMPILEWILDGLDLSEPVRAINRAELSITLPGLSFVRRSGSSNDFVLHDEMRRLVTKYCWEVQDTDRRVRKDISRRVISYYEQEIERASNEQQRQGCIIEMLYHRMFVDLDDGLHYFQQHFQPATRLWKTAFARLLWQEVQKFVGLLSPAQYDQVRLAEAKLLRTEENPAAAQEVLQRLKEEADPQWFHEHQSGFLMEEGLAYLRQSKLSEAASSFTQCLSIEQSQGNELLSAHLLTNLGFISRRRGQFAAALSYYEKSTALFKKLGQQRDYANTLNSISTVYRLQGKIEEAMRRCKIAWRIRLDLFREGKSSEVLVGLSRSSLGVIYLNAGDIIEAERCFRQAFEIYQRANYKTGIASVYNRFGQTQLAKGDLESAREWFAKGQELARDVESEQYINSLNKQGRICALQSKWEEAVAFFEQGIMAARQVSDYYQQTEGLIDLADALRHLGEDARIQQALQEAEDLASRENYFYLLGRVEQMRGEICYSAGEYAMAFQHFVLYCRCMAHYNAREFSVAVRKVVDALLGVPGGEVLSIVEALRAYWITNHLDKEYPEMIRALEEMNEFMII